MDVSNGDNEFHNLDGGSDTSGSLSGDDEDEIQSDGDEALVGQQQEQ